MAQIRQKNPPTGITYVYEAEAIWDKEKKQSRYGPRRLVGHVDPASGEVVANRATAPRKDKDAPGPARLFAGATHLLTELAGQTGLSHDLAVALQDETAGEAVESFAQFLVAEAPAPAMRFPRWARTHVHPLGRDVSSQAWSELFAMIGQEELESFFAQRIRRASGRYWFFDTTSVSSYSGFLERVRWGHNKGGVALPQINLAVVTDAGTGLPLAFKDLPGSIPDVVLVKQLVQDFSRYGAGAMKVCMDRGFYSKKNIDELMRAHLKFLVVVRIGVGYVRQAFADHGHALRGWEHYDPDRELYAMRIDHRWDYDETHPRAQDTHQVKRSYLCVYFDPNRAVEEGKAFAKLLARLARELDSGEMVEEHTNLYAKYFHKVRGGWAGNDDAIEAERARHGCFALLSNDASLTCWEALDVYRSKDQIEKAFHDIKDRLDFRTTAVHNQETLTGKLFIVFAGLILTTELRRRMKESDLDKEYTLTGLLDELETIEQYQTPGHRPVVPHITARQNDICTRLQVQLPTTS